MQLSAWALGTALPWAPAFGRREVTPDPPSSGRGGLFRAARGGFRSSFRQQVAPAPRMPSAGPPRLVPLGRALVHL